MNPALQEAAVEHPPEETGDASTSLLRYAPSLYTVGMLAVLGAVFLIGLRPRGDTDYWWHLKVGQYITVHHVVPAHDFMSFTFAGHAWTDHEWLAEVVMYNLYRLAGYWGPIVLFAAVICLAFTLVYANMVARGINRILALFVLTLAFFSSTASWGVRIQMVSMMLVALYAYLLLRYRQTGDRRLLVAFPLIMLLWANVHGGFALGLIVMGLTLGGEILNRVTGSDAALSWNDLKALAIALVATLAVTIVNPNGFRQLLYPLTFVTPNAYTNLIQESASPDFHTPIIMAFEGLLLLLVVAIWFARPRINWAELLTVLLFTHLALSQVRNVPLWAVLISPLLAAYLQQTGPALARQFRLPSRKRRGMPRRLVPAMNLVFLVLISVLYVSLGVKYLSGTAITGVQAGFPTRAVSYMKSHRLPPRVFTTYAWGGYLLWNLYPAYRDFMDSRADTLYNATILNAYLDVYDASPQWSATLRRYGVQDVLIERTAPLAQVLAENRGWKQVHSDSTAVLFTRR